MSDQYVDSMLGDGETILAQGRQHWMALIRFALQPILVFIAAIVCLGIGIWLDPTNGDGLFNQVFRWIDTLLGLVTAGLFILAVIWFPLQAIRWVKRRYLVTDRRVLYVEGVLRRNSRDASLQMITDVGFRQTFLGRHLGYGDLVIATAANRPLDFRQMRDAILFKKVIMAGQQGTIQARADEILGKTPTTVPSVAAVAAVIDPSSVVPTEPAWDGSDVPEMAEDDLPPADPLIFAPAVEAAPDAVAEAVAPVAEAAEAAPDAVAEAVAPVAEAVEAAPDAVAEAVAPVAEAVEAAPDAVAEAVAPVAEAVEAAPDAVAEAVAPVAEAAEAAPDAVAEAVAPAGPTALTTALTDLAGLRDSGAITEVEFQTRKQELLDRI